MMNTLLSFEETPAVSQSPPEPSFQKLFVLMEDDTFLVVDAFGDLNGHDDGLFHHDTRILSCYHLFLANQRPSLLSATVSQDNVYAISHLTNHPLPLLGDTFTPQGALHIERKKLLWGSRMFERIRFFNYSDQAVTVPLGLHFSGDFRDMFEVRGQQRPMRGTQDAPDINEWSATLRYYGLDKQQRCMALSFSEAPLSLDGSQATFEFEVGAHAPYELYIEVGMQPIQASRVRFRRSAAKARWAMRKKQRSGAHIKASGRLFQGWLDKSRADLALLTSELPTGPYPYAGVPWYSTPFGRDAIITAYQLLWLNPQLARGVLAYLALHQAKEVSTFRDAEPGKIMHETRKGEMSSLNELPFSRYYGGVDTTPLFVLLAGAYAKRTGDMAFIEELWPALERAAQWIEGNASKNPDGFLSYARGEESGLANQGWKDSHDSIFHADGSSPEGPIALVEVQGYAYRAYLSMAELAETREDRQAAQHWQQRAEALQEAVERCFWLEDKHFYALALDGNGKPCAVNASNVGHLLFTGLPAPKRGKLAAQQLLERSFDSGWGIRTVVAGSARFNPMSYHNGSIWPHDVALCAAGIARYGEHTGSVHLLAGIFEAAAHFGMRLPELFCGFDRAPSEAPTAYPVACLPQAWAAGSVFMLLQACLGINIDAQQCLITITAPQMPTGIDRLEVRHITFGEHCIDITFQRIGSRVTAYVERQEGPHPVKVDLRL
ncbi:amylo-alpha-1,6-glucosidase [Pseudomonas asuensis]|uniref:Amylo-alpha-1,6-glucosidase n=1 Tax=Pseudomonas asuensis TaxID=1825787 RepID=A0ABQ2GZM1_9PSED|nr:amylo-alpha-1,6-glucosidase [Pseudomonas asuensis]GGM19212.1 amylo-alpha-1,6-glucosidase [Pseudomonas asuensis]